MNLEFEVPSDHPSFPHHFPEQSLVPGYLLLQCVVMRLADEGAVVGDLKSCKFLKPVMPGEHGEIHYGLSASGRAQVDLVIDDTRRLRAVFEVAG